MSELDTNTHNSDITEKDVITIDDTCASEENPFLRKPRLAHTPTKNGSGDREEYSKDKRKREENSPEHILANTSARKKPTALPNKFQSSNRETNNVDNIMSKVKKRITELMELIAENNNTKTEIKSKAKEISAIFEQLRIARQAENTATKATRKSTQNSSVQTVSEMQHRISTANTTEEIREIIGEKWGDYQFQRVKITATYKYEDLHNLAFFVDCNGNLSSEDKAPPRYKMEGIKKFLTSPGSATYIEQKVLTAMGGEEMIEETSTTHFLSYKQKIEDTVKLDDTVKALREYLKNAKGGIGELNLSCPRDINPIVLRKLLEVLTCPSNLKINILTCQKPSNKLQSYAEPAAKSRKPPREGISVKMQGKTYAETLQEIKNSVKLKHIGAKIAAVKEGKDGSVLLHMRKGENNTEELKKAIGEKIGKEGTIRNLNSTKKVIIKDMEEGTTVTQILEAIKECYPEINSDSISCSPIRPAYYGCATTVSLPTETANKITKNKHILIGLVSCRVTEYVRMIQCFKCLGFGHLAHQCPEKTLPPLCMNCSEKDHTAKQCKGKPYCVNCKEEHPPSSIRCPIFRRELRKRQMVAMRMGPTNSFDD